MKKILLLAVSLSTPCYAGFNGTSGQSSASGSYFKTEYTISDRAQFHIGCGIGTDKKAFSMIGLKHPSFYSWHGVSNIQLKVDGGNSISIKGGSKEYDDMYYSRNPPIELFQQIVSGKSVEVSFFKGKRRVTFSLAGSKKVYTKLWKECGL
ncbi:hypothetical protein LFS00_003954 [Vibrio alginolyticus]|nr:hypothetical protein [Vibrio alginolyticus]